MPTAKSPDFYTLNPKENCVLYCAKVNGAVGDFKYIPIEEVPYMGTTVGKYIKDMKAVVDDYTQRIHDFIIAFQGVEKK